jgi:hypothetical protein
MASSRTISSTFQDRAFFNRAKILNLLTNEYQINSLSTQSLFIFLSININNATINNNKILFNKDKFDLFLWSDRELNDNNNNNNNNMYIKLDYEDKLLI